MTGHAVARLSCVALAVAGGGVAACGDDNERSAPTTTTTPPPRTGTSTELRLDPSEATGRQRTKIVAYEVRRRRVILMIGYSTGQRLREVRLRRRSPRVVIADVVLTQQGPQDWRLGCVSVRWEAPTDAYMLQRGRRVERARDAVARCRPTAIVDANTDVDANLLPPDHPLAETP